ncbi:hypothetical protein ABFO19_09385 [Xanthomonas citri pv. glycines]|uniref:Uncharacterized protein n=1 Tax=Xanthomonas campestris pv. glycines TaxID=473421 RepID=A0AAX0I4W5_XANCG|nr:MULTISPECIES: hypothetical protein [Xanthomonas]AOY63387.1 hypothetical protein BHE84_15315 [Xanthomonas citri pv. glycines str. 8ra]EWC53094.1 hypothetical protein XAR_0534 [Xanthomonas citri pv. glycines str. 8ra]MBV6785946.1 hypothetical protein [Xanthomonas campestris pv. uppalii]MBV6794316.1 hypothetical protein [Xanthomonas campestris pv. daturae]OEY98664.1 hypothetical protein BIY41_09870 [Xanthomonas citri pv. glycines]
MSGDDIDVITPPSRVIAFRGEKLEVTPLTLAQIGPFIKATRPIIGRVIVAASLAGAGATIEVAALMMDVLEQNADAFAKGGAIVAGKQEAWIAGASLADAAALVEAVVELNEDFFGQRLPSLMQMAGKAIPAVVATQAEPDGPTSSTFSSPVDTSDQMS